MPFRMLRIEYQVCGRVQGVNFRAWTASKAKQLGITGWVRNTPEGHVDGAALGPEADIKTFKQLLHEGPSIANVTDVYILKEEKVEDPAQIGWTSKEFSVRR